MMAADQAEFTSHTQRRLLIPFIGTRPLTDLYLIVALLPLWWALGFEQFVAPVVLTLSAIKLLMARQKIRVNLTIKLLAIFIIFYLISGLFIVENQRILTFVRNLSMYYTALLVLLIVINEVHNRQQMHRLIQCVFVAMLAAATIGAAGFLGLYRPQFTSVMASVLPDWITATDYGRQIAQRTTGGVSWFFGLGSYFRTNSLFLFSTMYAAAIALALPTMLYLHDNARGLTKLAFKAALLLMLVNLVFTTGRVAAIALLLGALYWFLSTRNSLTRAIRHLALAVVVFIAMLAVPAELSLDTALYARGSGSVVSRSVIYQNTFVGYLERPVFGWGTERDILADNFPYPAGSHSYFLGTLYKQGAAGFIVFLAIWWSVWRETRSLPRRVEATPEARLIRYGRWTVLTALLISITSVLDLDATVMLILWVIFASIMAARMIALSGANESTSAT